GMRKELSIKRGQLGDAALLCGDLHRAEQAARDLQAGPLAPPADRYPAAPLFVRGADAALQGAVGRAEERADRPRRLQDRAVAALRGLSPEEFPALRQLPRDKDFATLLNRQDVRDLLASWRVPVTP